MKTQIFHAKFDATSMHLFVNTVNLRSHIL